MDFLIPNECKIVNSKQNDLKCVINDKNTLRQPQRFQKIKKNKKTKNVNMKQQNDNKK
jgi:hypothetical protein